MVKVLANGDIVPDNDPRAQSAASSTGSAAGPGRPRQQGYINHNNEDIPRGQSVSLFDSINQRLTAVGVPTWHAGPYSVEPVVSLGFLLSLLLAGFRGLLFSGILFLVVKYSQSGAAPGRPTGGIGNLGNMGGGGGGGGSLAGGRSGSFPQRPNGSGGSGAGGWWAGGGHRLGRS